jgi:uncharacterized RDD family membrane protein YckC
VTTEWQQHEAPLEGERRTGYGRREEDEWSPRTGEPPIGFRSLAATLLTFCLGLAILYLGFGLVGAADFGDSIGFTIGAIVLAALWVFGAWQRSRKGAYWITRNERERRGF